MSIDIGVSEPQPIEVVFEEVDSSMEVTLDSVPVSIELDTPPELQVSINEVYSTTGGGGSGKSPYIGGNGNWFYYNDITEQYIDSGVQAQGDDGVTFTPSVDLSGNISWTNNGGLLNPSTINIKGPAGNDGKSAYQSALDGGYLQSESQFNTDLSKVSNGDANTGNIILTTLKQVADRTDRLLLEYTVTSDTTTILIDRDKYNTLFSNLNIKVLDIDAILYQLTATVATNITIRVNGVIANYNNSNGSVGGMVTNGHKYSMHNWNLSIVNGFLKRYMYSGYFSGINPASGNGAITSHGFNQTINAINSIEITSTIPFSTGSSLKFYRND